MKTKLLILIFLFSLTAFAADITAEGYGNTETEARANASAELSFMIYSTVSSSVSMDMSDNPAGAKQNVSKQVDIKTSVPLLGVEYKMENTDGSYKAVAVMRSQKCVPIYTAELENSLKEINGYNTKAVTAQSGSEKYGYVMSALASFDNFVKMRSAVSSLGGAFQKYPDVTLEELRSQRDTLAYKADSLKHAADIISKELSATGRVYVYYPSYRGSDEVTPFATVFRDMLTAKMNTSDNISYADYFLETEYSTSDNGMNIFATLTDKSGATVKKSMKLLDRKAYAGYKTEPVSVSFENLLKLGMAKSSDFTARITTKNGKKSMLYKSGETIELFVKLNSPGYFFLVGHVDKKGEKYSYLVDFYEAQGNRKFVRYVDADEINRWISLGEFDVVPPYGLETFQLIASSKDPVGMVPANVFDPQTELYIISKNINDGIMKTRALKMKNSKKEAVAEDILVFSTIDK